MSTDHPRGQDDTPTPTTPLAAVAPQEAQDSGGAGSAPVAPRTPGGNDGGPERDAQAGPLPPQSGQAKARAGDASVREAQDAENPANDRNPGAEPTVSAQSAEADGAAPADADAGTGAAGGAMTPSTHGWSADHGHAASRHLPHEGLGIAQPLTKSDALLDHNRRGRGRSPYSLHMPESLAAASPAHGASPHQAPSVPRAADVPEVPSPPEPSTVPQAPEVPQTPTLEDSSRETTGTPAPAASEASTDPEPAVLHAPAQSQEAGQAQPSGGAPRDDTPEAPSGSSGAAGESEAPARMGVFPVGLPPLTESSDPSSPTVQAPGDDGGDPVPAVQGPETRAPDGAGGVARIGPTTASQRRIIVDDMPEAEPIMMDAATPEEPLSDAEAAATAEPEPSAATTDQQAMSDRGASALAQPAAGRDAVGADRPAAVPVPQEARPEAEPARSQEPPVPGTAARPAGAAPADPLRADAGATAPPVARASRSQEPEQTPEPERAVESQGGPAPEAASREAPAGVGEAAAIQEPQASPAAFGHAPSPSEAASASSAPEAGSPGSRSERDILLEGAGSLTRPPRRTASHWAGVLLALVLLPVAWFLINNAAMTLTGGDATVWPTAVSTRGLLELGAGALLLCLALLMAHRSSLGTLILGGITLLIGLPFVIAPGSAASLLGPTVERLQAHSELGEALATYAMVDGLTGRFALMGLVIIMVGLVAHTSRRSGRREQAAQDRDGASSGLDSLPDERS